MTTPDPAAEKPVVPVRFPPDMKAAMDALAQRDGMSVSAWVRRLVDQEVARREGKCPTCAQPVPGQPAAALLGRDADG